MASTKPRRILFTVDVEEFDTALEYGHDLSLTDQIAVSTKGLRLLAERFEALDARTTLFTTANYALREPTLIRQLANRHEIASHGYFHTTFEPGDLAKSKQALEKLLGKPIRGFRRARMGDTNPDEVAAAGYTYNSSLHPTYIPGRYNHWGEPRLPFREQSVWQIPASVTPRLRLPLFWLSLKNFPFALYKQLCLDTLRADGYVNIYVHPWEFTNLSAFDKIPAYVKRYADHELLDRVEALLTFLRGHGEYSTMGEFADTLYV